MTWRWPMSKPNVKSKGFTYERGSKKEKLAVDRRSLYERLKKSVNLNSTASEIEFPNCNLQTLAFEQLPKKLLEERQLNLNETSHQTYRRYI